MSQMMMSSFYVILEYILFVRTTDSIILFDMFTYQEFLNTVVSFLTDRFVLVYVSMQIVSNKFFYLIIFFFSSITMDTNFIARVDTNLGKESQIFCNTIMTTPNIIPITGIILSFPFF